MTTAHRHLDSRIFYRECLSLAQAGHQVSLISPNENEGVLEGVALVRCWYPRWRITRIAFAWQVLLKALRQRGDIYHLHAPELIPLGLVLTMLGRRVVYDVHEDYPSMMLVKHWIPRQLRPVVRWLVRASEAIAGRCFDGIVTADPAVLEYFPSVSSSRKIVFYNFPSKNVFLRNSAVASTVLGSRAKAPYDLVYLGGMSERAGTFVVLEALRLLHQRGHRLSVLMVGYFDDDETERRVREASCRAGQTVEVKCRVRHVDVPEILCQGRVGIVALQPIEKFLRNIPTKLFEYWACGLPVVASDLPPSRPFMQDGKHGILVDPSRAEDFSAAIASLLEDPERIERMGRSAQSRVIAELNSESEAVKLLGLYGRVRGS